MTWVEIAKDVKLTGSNDLDKILNDLKLSGFVRKARCGNDHPAVSPEVYALSFRG